jgi:Uncharacterized protein conserved in bacteria (DUF2125)
MNYSSRFFLYAPLALFLVLTAGVSANWWIEANALSAKLDSLNGRPAMPGVTLTFSSKQISGFPFNLDVIFHDFRIEVQTAHGPSSWITQGFALHALAYGREQMLFEAAGKQRANWIDLAGRQHTMPFEVGEWHASSIADDHGLTRFDMDLIGFGSPALIASRIGLHARIDPKADAIDVAAEVVSLRQVAQPPSLFGPTITRARVSASATPSRPFAAIRAAGASWESALDGWRRSGGVLHIAALDIAWDRLSAMGTGTLSLGTSHGVRGLIDFNISGIETLLDAAARRSVDGAPNHGIATALLDRAAKAGNNRSGLLGAVVGFRDGLVNVGDEPATTEEPLY